MAANNVRLTQRATASTSFAMRKRMWYIDSIESLTGSANGESIDGSRVTHTQNPCEDRSLSPATLQGFFVYANG